MRTPAASQQAAALAASRAPVTAPPRPLVQHGGAMIPHPIALIAAGVPARTARRWAAERRIPEPWRRWFTLTLDGDLGTAWPAWIGWKMDAQAIYSPDGWTFTRGELLALPFEYQRVAALTEEVRRLRDRPAAAVLPARAPGRCQPRRPRAG